MKCILKWTALILFAAIAAGIFLLDIPNWKRLDIAKIESASASTILYDANGGEIGGLYAGGRRKYASLDEMPPYLPQAFIAAEDTRFYEHNGVDVRRIFGAMLSNMRSMRLSEGASTITQQLVRMTHLSAEKTFSRKAQEAFLALRLERQMSKDDILQHYINIAYFGSGAYGAASAAQRYFSKDISELTLAEAALLAGLVKAPSSYAPDVNPQKALERRAYVLRRMREEGYISEEERAQADAEELHLHLSGDSGASFGWYADAAMEEAMEVLGISAEAFLSGGYRVYTALDPKMQEQADALYADTQRFPPDADDGEHAQSALIAIEPGSGEIVCIEGGRAYTARRALNRAVSIRRQPGSAFKPVSVYAAAVDADGFVPASLISDEQRDFGGGYSPGNAGGKFFGTVTLRTALSKSLNAASVDLLTRTGIGKAREYAMKLGLPMVKSDSGLSIALGALTEGVSPMELCSAYAALANGGVYVEPHCIRRIEDADGNLLYRFDDKGRQAISAESASILTSMLETAVESGSAQALRTAGFPIAAKTGTVSMENGGNRDAWIAAYTENIALCVWMGFDNADSAHCIPEGSGGSAYPARLAAAFFSACAKRADSGAFGIAEGLKEVVIDQAALEETGQIMLACEYTPPSRQTKELFRAGSEPTIVSNIWRAPDMVWDLFVRQEDGQPVIEFTAQEGAGYRIFRTTNGERTLIAETVSELPGIVRVIDGTAQADIVHAYSVEPYHAALAAENIDLTGTECLPVVWTPSARILEWINPEKPPEAETAPAKAESPLFTGTSQ